MADFRVHYIVSGTSDTEGSVLVPQDKRESVQLYIRDNFENPVWELDESGQTLPPESLIRTWFITEGLPWP